MIGLDTNVIVRYIMQDEPTQAALATRAIESLGVNEPGFVSVVTIVELGWVLAACYDLDRAQVADAIEALLRVRELVVDRADSVVRAVGEFRRSRADLADCLISQFALDVGCLHTLTFDRDAARSGGMRLLV